MVQFSCPKCSYTFSLPDENVGNDITCERCGQTIRVTDSGAKDRRAPATTVAPDAAESGAEAEVPRYRWLWISGTLLIVVGIIWVVLIILFSILGALDSARRSEADRYLAMLLIRSIGPQLMPALFVFAAGHAMHALRDMVRNSWRLRAVK